MTSAPGHARSGPHAHEHGPGADSDRRHLLIALALLAAFMAAEVITAILSGSLALLSDAGHMLSDVGAIGGALWAISLAARPASGKWTYGLKRAEILSAATPPPPWLFSRRSTRPLPPGPSPAGHPAAGALQLLPLVVYLPFLARCGVQRRSPAVLAVPKRWMASAWSFTAMIRDWRVI